MVLEGPGRWGLKRAPVARAEEQLAGWADRWRLHRPDLPTDPEQLAWVADRFDDRPGLWRAFNATAHRAAERDHPEHAGLYATAKAAVRADEQAQAALTDAHRQRLERLDPLGPIAWAPDPTGRLADLERHVATAQHELAGAHARIARLATEPALLGQPPDWLTAARDAWRARRDTEHHQRLAFALEVKGLVRACVSGPGTLGVRPRGAARWSVRRWGLVGRLMRRRRAAGFRVRRGRPQGERAAS